MEHKFSRSLITVLCALILLGGALLGESLLALVSREPATQSAFTANLGFSVHCTITFWRYGKIVFQQYHSGYFTYLGYNITAAKLLGNSSLYNMTLYNLNATFISIGWTDTSSNMNQTLTVLPNEWNRTAGTIHDIAVNANPSSFNLTGTIHPSTGPYNASCIGINYESGIGNNALLGYDTFTKKTGIDNTYTITIEFKVSLV
jgi:hypothetical protein